MWDIDTFWNHGYNGYPICAWCREGLKTDGQDTTKVLRERLGLKADKLEKPRGLMDKWL